MTESHVLIIIFYTGMEESVWLEPTYNPPSSQIILHILIPDCPCARRAKDVFSMPSKIKASVLNYLSVHNYPRILYQNLVIYK